MRPRRLLTTLGVLLALLVLPVTGQTIADYQFSTGTGAPTDMSSGTTTIIGPSVDDGSSGIQNIGFTFRFANLDYTQYSVSSNGAMRLGSTVVTTSFTNNLTATLPMIASFFEDMHTGVYDGNGYVKAKVTGTAPNRVLTIEWRTRAYASNLGNSGEIYQWQCRLYETSNMIDFLYMTMRSDRATTASIGIANSAAANDFISVTPGSPPTISRTAINNSASIGSATTALAYGTRWEFSPCNANVKIAGNVSQGGTVNMTNNDLILTGASVMRGSAMQYTPFTISLPAPACASRNYTFSISGTAAGDYSISPSNGVIGANGSVTPTITFRPQGIGIREATLFVADDNGFSRSYLLRAQGVTRINWTGNTAQGGTPGVADGDTILNGSQVTFGTSKTFTPLTIENINLDPLASPPAPITYILNDPIGNYSIAPSSDVLNGGQQSVPQITFNALGDVGIQEATLTVIADGESRTYLLRAFNAAPGGELFVGSVRITRTTPLLVDQIGCVGSEVVSIQIEAVNTGAGDFVVRGGEIFRNDTVVGPGTPPYPLLRDQGGQSIRSIDYFLTNAPGVAPKSANPAFDSLVIPEKQSRTFYLNMVATRPGKRFGTVFFRTNGFNMSDPDVNGIPTRGVLQAGVFGKGRSALLSGSVTAERPEQVTLQTTDVRETRTVTRWISNGGECDLRISRSKFRFESGDVGDFKLLTILPNTPISGDDYILAPGARDSVVVSFSPETYGSRRATIHLATNDSTLGDESVTERGVYYWDFFGVGRVGIEARNLQLPPAVIGGETSSGFVTLENTSGGIAEIESITIVGGNGEIIESASRRWPSLPILLKPAEIARLWVDLKPDPNGTAGNRAAELVIRLRGGNEVRVQIRGYVGTRLLSVQPANLFTGAIVSVGEIARQFVTITNVGTLPLHLTEPVLAETNPGDYRVGMLPRRVLEPGQTELLEVTYTPQAVGSSSGTLTFGSNGTNGNQVVNLGGEGTGTVIGPGGGSSITVRGRGAGEFSAGKENGAKSLAVASITPNPARDIVRIDYGVTLEGAVRLELYDAAGNRVLAKEDGVRGPGDHSMELSVEGLASGTYHYVVVQGDRAISGTVRVVK